MAWQSDRQQIIESGHDIIEELEKHLAPGVSYRPDEGILESGFLQFRRIASIRRLGGFGGAPKFPRGVAYNFLFRYCAPHAKIRKPPTWCSSRLREMAKGGMNDQLGGGFHRYSVDARWFVPHFEKMLYDQAQLAISYLEAYQISGRAGTGGSGARHLRIRPARHDGCKRRLLLRRRCRQRDRSSTSERKGRGRILHLDTRRNRRSFGPARR